MISSYIRHVCGKKPIQRAQSGMMVDSTNPNIIPRTDTLSVMQQGYNDNYMNFLGNTTNLSNPEIINENFAKQEYDRGNYLNPNQVLDKRHRLSKRGSDKLYERQNGGFQAFGSFAKNAYLPPLAYMNGINQGNALGFNQDSTKDLALVAGLNALGTQLGNAFESYYETADQLERKRKAEEDEYIKLGRDNNYNIFSNSPYYNSFFRYGGKKQTILNPGKYSMEHRGSNFPALTKTLKIWDSYKPVRNTPLVGNSPYAGIHGSTPVDQYSYRSIRGPYERANKPKELYYTNVPIHEQGQYIHGKNIVDVPLTNGTTTMKGLNHTNLGIGLQSGQQQIMKPGEDQQWPNDDVVREIPLQRYGGSQKATNNAYIKFKNKSK